MLLAGFLIAGKAGAQTAETTTPERPVAIDARVVAVGDVTRLSFSLSKPVVATAFVMEKPDRLVVELPEVNFQTPPQTGRKGAGLVAGYRYGLFAVGRSRIVVDLAGPARVTALRSQETTAGLAALVIELAPASPAEFARSAAEAAAANRAAAAKANGATAATHSTDKRPVVVIDPGHGGIDPGAVTQDIAEKAIVLAFGLRLRDLLEASGRYRVIMTRSDDSFLTLADRVRVGRENSADLFVSIHADSLSSAQDVRGATIYTGSERATDAESARLAARENQVDALAGVEIPAQAREEVADILLDLARRETRAFSATMAGWFVRELGAALKLHKVPQRSAGFRVLSAPDVPSVLIELGYVSSRKDVEEMTSERWRADATQAAKRAVDRFFDTRKGPLPAGPAATVAPQ